MTQQEMDERNAAYAAAADMLKSLVDEWNNERAHADRLAEALRRTLHDYAACDLLAVHDARRPKAEDGADARRGKEGR